MFDQYMIYEAGFQNVVEGGTVTGFQVQARLPYYRGLGLSMVEDIVLTIDGETVPRESLLFTVHNNTYTLDALESVTEDRWEFGEVATLRVNRPGGLAEGEHEIELMERLRISYLPFPSITRDKKQLLLAG